MIALSRKTRLRRTSLVLATMLAIGGGCAVQAAGTDYLGSRAVVGQAMTLHPHDVILGTLTTTEPTHLAISLKLRHQDQLNAFIDSVTAPGSQVQPMTTAQFNNKFAPTHAQAQAVANFLSESGFSNIVIADNQMLVTADGTTTIAAAAFGTTFGQVQTANGQLGFANTSSVQIPTNLQDIVLAVVGLQNVYQAHTMFVPVDPLSTQAVTGHNPTEFAAIYGGSGQTTGAGVTVGIITQGKITQTITDLNSFTSQNGLATVTTQTVNTNGTSSDASGVDEWNLDSQDIVGMAGGQIGKLIFYNIPTLSNANLTADFNTVVSANATKVINVSLGECETSAQGDGSAASQDQSFQQAVAQGQTISVSTGDSGADECGNGGTTPSWPAASQYVIAAAGTTLNASTTAWSSETVWSGSGGSQSTFEPKPSWQTLWSGAHRGVADIAFDGDPNSGAKIIVNGSSTQVGGTSLSSPLFVGAWARVIAAKGASVGFAGPLIYQLPTSTFHDITSGNNNGSTASAGYDLASGRGSMIISSLLANVGGGGGGGNVPPVANFSFTTNALVASFTDSSSDSDGSISSRAWTFGDGGTSAATNPSHTYASAGTFSVKETVTDNGGATASKTSSVTVSSGGGGGSSVLQNGVAVTGLSGTKGGSQLNYTMVVPAGATNLKFVMSGGTGDADMYVKFGSAPTTSSYDCRPYVSGNSETCTIASVQAGTYYVMLNAYATFTGVSLTGSFTVPSSNNPPTANFTFSASNLVVSFTDTSSDSDGTIASHSWTFGDGGTSTSASPGHTYSSAGTYSVTETVTDNGGLTASKTQSVTVTAGGGGGGSLQNGVALTGQAAATGAQLAYTVVIPAGASNLVIAVSGGTGDADLYVKFGSAPTLSSYDCRPYVSGNTESCTVASPQAGTYYVMLNGYSAFSGVSIKATWTTGGGGGNGDTMQNGVPITGLSATKNNFTTAYTLTVPAGQSVATFTISGSSGDADLYVRRGAAATTATYDCRPYLSGDNETCTFNAPAAGTYYVSVRAYATFSGVTLTGSYSP